MTLRRLLDSVVTRLLLLALCIVTLGTVARYYTLTHFLHDDLGNVVESQQLALASYIAHDIDEKIVQRQTMLTRLATSLPVNLLSEPERLRAWLKEHYSYQQLFSAGLFVVDRHGKVIADYPTLPRRARTNYASRDYVQAALAGHVRIGRPTMGHTANEPILPMAAPIASGQAQPPAVLVGVTALTAPGFLDALRHSRIGDSSGGFLLISPQDKLFVSSSSPDMELKPTPAPGVNPLHDRAMAGFRGTGITVNERGEEEVSAMVSVPSVGWFVVAHLPSRDAFATIGRLQHFLVKNAIMATLAFMFLSALGLYFVFRPLFHAVDRAERMTRGDLPLEPLPVGRHDEVGHLLMAFNRLLSKLNDNQAELAYLAHHDKLTGLPNRALLADRLHQLLAQAQRNNQHVAVLFLDLDGFKQINDNLGHEAGDEALRQVADRFALIVRQADTLARIGGDEFVLLLSSPSDKAEQAASVVAAKCIDTLKTPVMLGDSECVVGVSIGIALGDGFSTSDSLLLAADQAMYQAKNAGRGRYVIHTLAPSSQSA